MIKRFISTAALIICAVTTFAQKDVTTFLGIPVDGNRTEMRKKIIAKGFTPRQNLGEEFFEGEFNGTNVELSIVTNNNKVYRIMLTDAIPRNESDIKIRFNTLVHQFEKNQRYQTLKDFTIPEKENISYEMSIQNKVYEAVYFQKPDLEKHDTIAFQKQALEIINNKYSEEQLENPTEEIQQDIENTVLSIAFDLLSKKVVWFRIVEDYGKYRIILYYDNEYNHANGEDL